VEPTLSELLIDLSEKTTKLVRQEVLLAKTEIQESLAAMGKGIGLLVAGGVVLYSALVVFLGACVLALGEWLGVDLWVSAVLVAAIVAIAGACLQAGWRALRRVSVIPTKTI
jgi:hypothetical protein